MDSEILARETAMISRTYIVDNPFYQGFMMCQHGRRYLHKVTTNECVHCNNS